MNFPTTSMQRAVVALSIAAGAIGLAGCGPQGTSSSAPNAMSATANTGTDAAVAQSAAPPARYGQPVPAQPAAYPNPQQRANAPTYAPPVQTAQAQPEHRVAPRAAPSAFLGRISSIEPIRERPPGTGTGAVIGGVLGAVVGHQFGQGNGNTALTVLGAAGGAVAGNNVERNIKRHVTGYRIGVRLDNGQTRTFEEPQLNGLQDGDRVRIEGGHLRRV
ncbi:MAG: glycine zipper 2TM domain-containing protein [Burkholderiales bacterium]|nr:glycine zipper 2TM domain-containing protein [Burkholderiales bacterium]MDE2297342.1 glycine zipper 2TM domain-containing protein [Burkholderiales bacterium]MDE2627887.1 glycine zipper 2TM domain-containing protein [Burkholderiales bacterium]